MANVRIVPLLGGVIAFLGAVVVLGGLAGAEMARGAIYIVGLAALFASFSAVNRRMEHGDRATTPDPERLFRTPPPGSNLRETLDGFRSDGPPLVVSGRHAVEGLRGAAVAAMTRFEGHSPESARERIDSGSWTDDPRAAAFLSDAVDAPPRTVRERLPAALGGDDAVRHDVRRTADAVASIGYGSDRRPETERLPADEEVDEPIVPRTTTDAVDGIDERASRSTGYWVGIGTVSFFAVGAGALAQSPAVVLAGVVGVGYAGFARAADPPTPRLALERTLSEESPEPGDEVTVTVTVENDGDRPIPDLRLVDGVPPGLSVSDGAARLGTALRPGESVTLEYALTARRGTHAFDPALVIVRDLSRAGEREFLVEHSTTLVCEPSTRPVAAPVPLRERAAAFAGRQRTVESGSGTEFHSVREYRRNDPMNRIDWNRRARTGDLATLEFHEERAARILILVDARTDAYLAPEPDAAHAVDRSVEAAGRIAASLFERGDAVGLAAIGPTSRLEGDESGEACWLAPASGEHHRERLRELLTTHPQLSTVPPRRRSNWVGQTRTIRRRLTGETQIVVLTPLCDDGGAGVARRFDARGHPVTVVSPDPTSDRRAGHRLASVGRRIRTFDLGRAGIPVVDWSPDETIDEALARANAGGRP